MATKMVLTSRVVSALYGIYPLVGLSQKSHSFAAFTGLISDTSYHFPQSILYILYKYYREMLIIHMGSISSRSGLRSFTYLATKIYNNLEISVKNSRIIGRYFLRIAA